MCMALSNTEEESSLLLASGVEGVLPSTDAFLSPQLRSYTSWGMWQSGQIWGEGEQSLSNEGL